MLKLSIAATLSVVALSCASPARAQGLPPIDAGVSVGTLGIGPEVSIRYPNSTFGVRLGAHFFEIGTTLTRDGIAYKTDASLKSGGATLDYYPFQGGFRLSGGVLLNGNSAKVSANPSASSAVTVGNHTYPGAAIGTLNGNASFNSVVPYLGLGYTYALFGVVPISLDVGAIYQGQGSLSLAASGPIASNAIFQQDLATESSRVRKDLSYASFYPVIEVSVMFRF